MRFRSRRRDPLEQQRTLVVALNADVDRQLASSEAASAAMSTRASILVAAAGLTSGVQLSAQSAWPAVLTAVAALVGVMLLVMRTTSEVPIADAEKQFWTDTPVAAIRNLMHWKLGVLRERERSLSRRRWLLVSGFALLAASIGTDLILNLTMTLGGGE